MLLDLTLPMTKIRVLSEKPKMCTAGQRVLLNITGPGQTMSVNAILASNFKLMSPIDGPCHSESGSTFNLKFDAVVLEKST